MNYLLKFQKNHAEKEVKIPLISSLNIDFNDLKNNKDVINF
jgi:hypothetical protein